MNLSGFWSGLRSRQHTRDDACQITGPGNWSLAPGGDDGPGDPPGGVPLWFITLWGGVGLFLWRLALPLLRRFGATPATP